MLFVGGAGVGPTEGLGAGYGQEAQKEIANDPLVHP